MAKEGFYLQCRVCRNPLVCNEQLDNEGCVSTSLWFLKSDDLPEWIENLVIKEAWQKGKLYCPKCSGRVGSFNFIRVLRCLECLGHDVPAIHLLRNRVDKKMVTPLHSSVPEFRIPSINLALDVKKEKEEMISFNLNTEIDSDLIECVRNHGHDFNELFSSHDCDQDTCPNDFIKSRDDVLDLQSDCSRNRGNEHNENGSGNITKSQARVTALDDCFIMNSDSNKIVVSDLKFFKDNVSREILAASFIGCFEDNCSQDRVVASGTECFKISSISVGKKSSSSSQENSCEIDVPHSPEVDTHLHLLVDNKNETSADSRENENGYLYVEDLGVVCNAPNCSKFEHYKQTNNSASENLSGFDEMDKVLISNEYSDVNGDGGDIVDEKSLRNLETDEHLQELVLLEENLFSTLENNVNQHEEYQVEAANNTDQIPDGSAGVDSPLTHDFLENNYSCRRKTKKRRLKREKRRYKKNKVINLNMEDETIMESLMLDFPDEHTCPVCFDLFCEPHMIVPCGHMMCEACLRRVGQKDIYRTPCPMCRQMIIDCNKNTGLIQELTEIYPDQYRARKKEQRRYLRNQFSPLPHRQSALHYSADEIRNRILGNHNVPAGQFIKMKLLLGALLLFFLMMPVVSMGKAVINSATSLVRSLYRR